ncbi:MAG: hypothetical protein AB1500_12345 [Bacillota bacterium]
MAMPDGRQTEEIFFTAKLFEPLLKTVMTPAKEQLETRFSFCVLGDLAVNYFPNSKH